jgi:polar amino acid transport system substrate-binding protein
MKRSGAVLIAAGALAICTALASCGSDSSSSQTSSPPGEAIPSVAKDPALAAKVPGDIQSAGVIQVASDATYPPFESVRDGVVVGLEPDLAKAIGDVLGVRVEFVNGSFDAIIPSLAANKVDMAMSSIGDNKERQNTVDFVTYYWNGTLVLVKKGNPKQLKADETCGAHIGVIRGSLQQTTFLPAQAPKCASDGKPAPIAEVYQTGPQAQLALQSGRIDGVMSDAPPLLDVVAQQAAMFETVGPLIRNPNPGGAAFPKDSKLVEPVHEALNVLFKNGTYTAILKKWNLESIAINQPQINGAVS